MTTKLITSAMEKHVPQKITQPSDLFGLEILPECTFESEYGKLTLGRVVVPDFSSDEKDSARLKKEFDNLKSFIEEKDLTRKLDIAEQICKNEFQCTDPTDQFVVSDFDTQNSWSLSEFSNLLKASVQARLFEVGENLDNCLCKEFGYSDDACLSTGIVRYNEHPVIQPLSCAGGVYAYCLKYVLNPEIFCPPDYRDLKNEILNDGIPTHNYLSWAFSCASVSEGLLSLVSCVHFWLC